MFKYRALAPVCYMAEMTAQINQQNNWQIVVTHQRHHFPVRGQLAVSGAVTAISALWPDHGGNLQMPIRGRGLGYAMSPGLQKG